MCNCASTSTDLLMVVIPVLITALVTLIVTIIENAQKAITAYREYSSNELKKVNKILPVLYNTLISMKLIVLQIESIRPNAKFIDTLVDYYNYKKDNVSYRESHQDDISTIPQFEMYMDAYIQCIKEMKNIHECEIPLPPIGHFIFNKKLEKLLSMFRYFPLIIENQEKQIIDDDTFKQELTLINKKWDNLTNSKEIQKYIDILNQWITKY